MNQTHRLTQAALTVALLGLACTNAEGPGPTDQGEELDETAGNEGRFRGRHRGWHHGEKGGHLLRAALEHVELSAEQRATIEGLLERFDESREERRAGRREHKEAVITAVRSGDVAGLQAVTTENEARATEKAAQMANTLNELHATLDAEQREALVSAVRAKVERHRARRAERMEGEGPGGDLSPADGPHRGHGRGHFRARKMHRLIEELELTEDQQARLEAAHEEAGFTRPSPEQWRERHEAHRARADELLSAFEQDEFDAGELGLEEHFTQMASGRMEHKTKGLAVLLPILTEEQREVLADRMERRFEEGHSGRRRHRGGGGR